MAKNEPKPYLLLVEGADDFHVISALMDHYQMPEVFDILDCRGINPLLQSIPAHLQLRQRVGIVVDADEQLQGRWNEVTKILSKAGFTGIPNDPCLEGTIIRTPGKPDVGIWLMPNNVLPGKLEDFISFLVPPQNQLWLTAVNAVDQVPACPEKFFVKDTSKAMVHTWLAWQQEPGIPMGFAISRRFLDADVSEVGVFIRWIRSLFL